MSPPSAESPRCAISRAPACCTPAVAPRQDDTVIVKNYPNSFRETALHQTLRDGGIEDVVVVGAMSDVCIDATARAAADLGYNLTVVHDACATRDKAFGDSVVPVIGMARVRTVTPLTVVGAE